MAVGYTQSFASAVNLTTRNGATEAPAGVGASSPASAIRSQNAGGGKSVNVTCMNLDGESLASAVQKLLDELRRVPFVEVTCQDSLRDLRGSSDVPADGC